MSSQDMQVSANGALTKRLLSLSEVRHAVHMPAPTAAESSPRLVKVTAWPHVSETAGRLLTSAAEAFADKGFHATTTRDIASGAGLSPAGVYVHFSSKEDVLFQLSRAGHEEALHLVTSAVASSPSASAQLTALVSTFSAWHAENYAVARVVQHEFPHLSPEHRVEVLRMRKRIDATVRGVLRAGVAAGEFTVEHEADTSLAILSIIVDVARWYAPSVRRTPEQIGRTNAALALRLVGS